MIKYKYKSKVVNQEKFSTPKELVGSFEISKLYTAYYMYVLMWFSLNKSMFHPYHINSNR